MLTSGWFHLHPNLLRPTLNFYSHLKLFKKTKKTFELRSESYTEIQYIIIIIIIFCLNYFEVIHKVANIIRLVKMRSNFWLRVFRACPTMIILDFIVLTLNNGQQDSYEIPSMKLHNPLLKCLIIHIIFFMNY